MSAPLMISIPPFVDPAAAPAVVPVEKVRFHDITLEHLQPLFKNEDSDSMLYVWDAVKACQNTDGGYMFMKTFEPAPERGFMFSDNPMLTAISSKMDDSIGHSGSSYGWTMRQLQCICRHGFNAYANMRLR